jgi:hypothetical protein
MHSLCRCWGTQSRHFPRCSKLFLGACRNLFFAFCLNSWKRLHLSSYFQRHPCAAALEAVFNLCSPALRKITLAIFMLISGTGCEFFRQRRNLSVYCRSATDKILVRRHKKNRISCQDEIGAAKNKHQLSPV